jgi:CPA2 family monovalent cation:H+ antiporter-2
MQADPLLQILILLTASVGVVALVRRLALPAILGYLLVGTALGPHALGLVDDTATTRLLAEFGITFLLFTLGLEFSRPRLLAMRAEVLGVGGLQVLLTAGIVAGMGIAWLGIAPATAIVTGGALAMSSTAIIVAQLTEQSEINRSHGRLAVAICLFQDLAFTLLLALESSLRDGGHAGGPRKVAESIAFAALALALVLAAGRWLLRPLFHAIASVRSTELFALTALLVVLAAAWATRAAGLSLALGGFLAGMMLAETEFRHQVEASIRSYRDVLVGLFFISVGMLLDGRLLIRDWSLVAGLLAGVLVLKTGVIALVARRASRSWLKALRTGIVAAQGGEFGFALLTLLLQHRLLAPAIAQPLLAATVSSMLLAPLLIRHNRRIANALLGRFGSAGPEVGAETRATFAVAEREHVLICGFGRVGQNVARVLERRGFEYLALEVDPRRIRAARQTGDPVVFGDAAQVEVLRSVGAIRANCVVVTFANPPVALRVVRAMRSLRPDVPILVRTPDDTHLEELQAAGATEVVPETFEASLMLASHLLLLLKEPISRVVRAIDEIRTQRYALLREVLPDEAPADGGRGERVRERLHSVVLPPHAWAVGRSLSRLAAHGATARVRAIRRDRIVGRDPGAETTFKSGDVVMLHGTPEAIERTERLLLAG